VRYICSRKSHLKKYVHEVNKPLKCKICDYFFYKKHYLNQHLQTVHAQKTFKFELVHYRFSEKGKLKKQDSSVYDRSNKLLKCKISDYIGSQKHNLKEHDATVYEEKKQSNLKFVITDLLKKVT
jgi:hypothetical protein